MRPHKKENLPRSASISSCVRGILGQQLQVQKARAIEAEDVTKRRRYQPTSTTSGDGRLLTLIQNNKRRRPFPSFRFYSLLGETGGLTENGPKTLQLFSSLFFSLSFFCSCRRSQVELLTKMSAVVDKENQVSKENLSVQEKQELLK